MEFLIFIGSYLIAFHILSIIITGCLRFFLPKIHFLVFLFTNAMLGILFIKYFALTWSISFLFFNLLTAFIGVGIASLLRKLIHNFREE